MMRHDNIRQRKRQPPGYDANAVAPSQDLIRQRVAEGGSTFVTVAEKILPILSTDQRKFGADRLRSLANTGVVLP